MSEIGSFWSEFRNYSLQECPIDNLLKKFNVSDYRSCLDKVHKTPELYNALAFVFSVHHLVNNLPVELPEDIRDYVKKQVESLGLPYSLNNEKLEAGLKKYFDYRLPHRSNGDRDIAYTRIREAGYSHLRFAQEICRYAVNERNLNKIVEQIKLADAYGNEDEIKEMKSFFSSLTQNNFEARFIDIGYSRNFAETLKERLGHGRSGSAWQLFESDIDVEYRNGDLYFSMLEEKQFPTEKGAEFVDFEFQMDAGKYYCGYKKINADGVDYRRYHIDNNGDIPVVKCRTITRNGNSVLPLFLQGCFIIWDVENRCCRKVSKIPLKLPAGKKYVICPTALFDNTSHRVVKYDKETLEAETVTLPYEFTGEAGISIVINCDQEYEILFHTEISLLENDKILSFSPDRRAYRYFSDDEHPFKDDSVSDDNIVEISCENQKTTFSLKDWDANKLSGFLYKGCTVSIQKSKFQKIVFFSEKAIQKWKTDLKSKTYPIKETVEINKIKFEQGVLSKTLKIKFKFNYFPIKFEIKREGAVLQLGSFEIYPARGDSIGLDIGDFLSAKLKYHHNERCSVAKSLASVRKNGEWLNYVAAHKVNYPCSEISMLNFERSYKSCGFWDEPEISLKLFFYTKDYAKTYNKGIACKPAMSKKLICCERKNFYDHDIAFNLTDYTLDQVAVDHENGTISHKISYNVSKEENRYLYCLPPERQDGEFIKIKISSKASLVGKNPWDQQEKISIDEIFSDVQDDVYGLLLFFVYEKKVDENRTELKRYSPGFFLKNPKIHDSRDLSSLQKALCACNVEALNWEFSRPGNVVEKQDFIEKVFENAENIAASHFFNCFFNNMRKDGRYIHASSFAFRAADYWIPAALQKDENGNFTPAQRRLGEHWDFELFGYEEMNKYLPELPREKLIKELQKDNYGLVMGSLFYSLTGNNIFNDENLVRKFHPDNDGDSNDKNDDLLFENKIIFLTKLFKNENGQKIECGNFNGKDVVFNTEQETILLDDLIYAVDELAYRIHAWKKTPHLSDLYLRNETWNRKNSEDPYYYTEQYLRGELVYWRKMSSKNKKFAFLRNLVLCRVAQYAEKDGYKYNI